MVNQCTNLMQYYDKYKASDDEDFYKVLGKVTKYSLKDITQDYMDEIANMLNQKDKEFCKNKPKHIRVTKSNEKRTVYLPEGKLTYRRNSYHDTNTHETFYFVDQYFGIPKSKRYHPSVYAELLLKLSHMSFSKAAKELKHVQMCPKTAWNILHSAQLDKISYFKEQRKNIQTVYIEADEDHENSWKNRKHTFWEALIYVHEGRETKNGRTRLINTKYFGGKKQTSELWEDVAEYIHSTYGQDVNVIISGDGANWIKSGLDYFKNVTYNLDKFHAVKAISKICGDNQKLKKALYAAIKVKDKKKIQDIFDALNYAWEKSDEYKWNCETYIMNNLDSIDLSKKYRCSAEAHISHVYADRMSSRPLCWTKHGSRKMAKLRTLIFSGINLEDYIFVIF